MKHVKVDMREKTIEEQKIIYPVFSGFEKDRVYKQKFAIFFYFIHVRSSIVQMHWLMMGHSHSDQNIYA